MVDFFFFFGGISQNHCGWIKGLNNLYANVPKYLMTVTPDVSGLLGAMTLQRVLVLKSLMFAVTACSEV